MVDLHTHILPGVDDGAKTGKDSLALLQEELRQGVDSIALTSHFFVDDKPHCYETYVERFDRAFETLTSAAEQAALPVRFSRAAEVLLTPEILQLPDISRLCYENTRYMLVEFPILRFYDWIPEVLYELCHRGVTPVIAHIERYPYVREDTSILDDFLEAGYVLQANASGVLSPSRQERKTVLQYIKKGWVHILATDTHSIPGRPPKMAEALELISRKLGSAYTQALCENAGRVFRGEPLPR